MSDTVRSTITVDKAFLRKERDQFYGDWTIAFWRELFQNSVDAGAKRINIVLGAAARRGSFGNLPEGEERETTSVVFSDDGHGMSAEVLDDVYFKMGKSTKDEAGGTSIGGFGRARIMTCFSQDRYTILTRDRFVMGDGVHYEHGSIEASLRELRRYREALIDLGEPAEAGIAGIDADIAMLRRALAEGGLPGCRVEVDLDTTEPSRSWFKRGTLQNMQTALRNYLSESQLSCEISINGQSPEEYFDHPDGKLQARRGPVRRELAIQRDGGKVAFATVHTSEGRKADFKGSVIVRVSGAAMYRHEIDGLGAQVIIEIDPALSRDVLNSNRDGMKPEFGNALSEFISELTSENLSALRDKQRTDVEIEGALGKRVSRPIDIVEAARGEIGPDEIERVRESQATVPRVSTIESLASIGLTYDVLKEFLAQSYYGESFLSRYADEHRYDTGEFAEAANEARESLYRELRSPEWFMENASEKVKAWVLTCLSRRVAEQRRVLAEAEDERLKGVNDVYISMEATNAKTRAAARRHHPENWNETTGRGKSARSLLAAWTSACAVSIEALHRLRPKCDAITWTTGFVYSIPEEVYQGDATRMVATEAKCIRHAEQDFRFLINPVKDDGTLRYSLSKTADLRRILVLSAHEIAHVLEMSHNETFASALTDVVSEIDWTEAQRRMKREIAAVVAAYGSGKARVHALDARGEAPRPAERLLAISTGNDPSAARGMMEGAEDGLDLDSDEWRDAPEEHATRRFGA